MKKNRINVGSVLLEIMIVIVGISIAFWVNNWGEERKERELETEFLKTLRSELARDSSAFAYQVGVNKENFARLERFTELCGTKEYDNDSIPWLVGNFLNRYNWILNTNTYDMLKSGGKLDIITDFELRNDISFFYKIRAYQTDRVLDISQLFLDNQMHPYLTKNTDYFISNNPNRDFVRDTEFQNLLTLWRDLNEQKLSVYKDILADISGLISKFDTHLK